MTSQALTTLQQAVAADPDNADLRHLLGAHCAQNGDYVQTERELYRAVSLNPLAHVARLQLRRLYLTENDPHRSISTWLPLDAPAERTALKSFKRGLEAMIRDDFLTTTLCACLALLISQSAAALQPLPAPEDGAFRIIEHTESRAMDTYLIDAGIKPNTCTFEIDFHKQSTKAGSMVSITSAEITP